MSYKFEQLEVWKLALEYNEILFAKLQAFRSSLKSSSVREETELYIITNDNPF